MAPLEAVTCPCAFSGCWNPNVALAKYSQVNPHHARLPAAPVSDGVIVREPRATPVVEVPVAALDSVNIVPLVTVITPALLD